ncbi:MAG: hypothetical protein CL424_09540 [Acidimicrobiaceae bacterium]|nr:hypothetical protein [Acidimicrobiaceae bacterium]
MNDMTFEGTLEGELVRVGYLPTGRLVIRRKSDGAEIWSGDPNTNRCEVSGHRGDAGFVYEALVGEHTITLAPDDTAHARKVMAQANGRTGPASSGAGPGTTATRRPPEIVSLEQIAGVVSVLAYLVGITGTCVGLWLAFQTDEVGSSFRSETEYPYVAPGIGIAVAACIQAVFIEFGARWAKAWAAVNRTPR